MDGQDRIQGSKWFAAPVEAFSLPGSTAKLVYLYLQRLAGPDGQTAPAQGEIATVCEVSVRAVGRAIAVLRARGAIIAIRQQGSDGHLGRNLYVLAVAGGVSPSATQADGVSPSATQADGPSATQADGGLQVVVRGRKTSEQPQDNPSATQAEPTTTAFIPISISKSSSTTTTPPKEEALEVLLGKEGFQVPAALLATWKRLFPLLDVDAEVAYVAEYARTRPIWAHKPRRTWRLTLLNWLKSEHEKTAARNGRPRTRPGRGDGLTLDERVAEYQRRMERGTR